MTPQDTFRVILYSFFFNSFRSEKFSIKVKKKIIIKSYRLEELRREKNCYSNGNNNEKDDFCIYICINYLLNRRLLQTFS